MEGKDEVTNKMEKLNVDEVKEEEKVDPNDRQATGEVEVSEGIQDFHRNQESRFLSSSSDWNDEKLGIPEKIKQALVDAEVLKPSKIQAYAVPIVTDNPDKSVVAQSHNGSGKTFAFALCGLLRVDPNDKNLQILVLAHSRELVHQIYEQIQILNKYTQYKVTEVKKEDKVPSIGQVTVITPGK
jgi:superfamily II DNA/RNA helicase